MIAAQNAPLAAVCLCAICLSGLTVVSTWARPPLCANILETIRSLKLVSRAEEDHR